MKRLFKILTALSLTTCLTVATFNNTEASSNGKVMWGKTELRVGQIGKITILENTNLITLNADWTVSGLSKYLEGEEFRVYQKKTHNGIEFYGVGAGLFIPKWDVVKYETPSKSKLEKLKKNNNEYSNAVKAGKLTKDTNVNAEILWTHLGYTKQGFYEHKDGGSAILYDKDGDPMIMSVTGDGLEAMIQIDYWMEDSPKVTKDTLVFFLGEQDGKIIYDKLEQSVRGKIDKNYINKRVKMGKRIVEISDRPSHSVIYIGKENSKYDNNWKPIK